MSASTPIENPVETPQETIADQDEEFGAGESTKRESGKGSEEHSIRLNSDLHLSGLSYTFKSLKINLPKKEMIQHQIRKVKMERMEKQVDLKTMLKLRNLKL